MSASKKGLRLILISAAALALVFGGIQFIQAQQIKTLKKPVKPDPVEEPQWEVTLAPFFDGNGTICGSGFFSQSDYTQVDVSEGEDYYGFYLRLNPSDTLGYPYLDFSGVSIESYSEVGEGVPCGFPDLGVGDCTDAPGCISCFINNNFHPMTGYDGMLLRFLLPADNLNNLETNHATSITGVGYLHISFYSEYGYEVPPEGTGYHNLYSFTTTNNLLVTKNPDGWTIEFNQPLEELIEEYTMEYEYELNAKKTKTSTKLVHPMTVNTNPIHFTMIWTQTQY